MRRGRGRELRLDVSRKLAKVEQRRPLSDHGCKRRHANGASGFSTLRLSRMAKAILSLSRGMDMVAVGCFISEDCRVFIWLSCPLHMKVYAPRRFPCDATRLSESEAMRLSESEAMQQLSQRR